MRKIIYLAIFTMCIASCGDGGKILPASKKINGPLGKFFEIVERDYKLEEGKVSIEFKRISEGGPNDASWSSRPTFTAELLDEDGNSISTESSDVVRTKDQLETVFALGVDETATITFTFDNYKKAAKFKVSSKWNEEESSKGNSDGTYRLQGFVDKYPVTMFLETKGTIVKGAYYYDKNGPTAKLRLSGTNENGVLELNETNSTGTPTGHFKGTIVNGTFKGVFSDSKGKKMPFELLEDNAVDFSTEDIDFSEDMTEDSSYDEDEGDSSNDELIDEYEKFYRTYINFVKKMDSNNPSTMLEYAKLMKQYESYSRKLEKAKGNLSASQLNRLNKINIELMEEMQKIEKR